MKYLYTIIFLALLIACGSSQKKPLNRENLTGYESSEIKGDTVKIANDSLDYRIIISEPGFRAFLVQQQPRGHYAQSYLERRNWQYVVNYNQRAISPNYERNLYPFQINYEPDIDYGYEVNYLLYNYFLFFMQKFNQNL